MPEPLKYVYNDTFIDTLGTALHNTYTLFDKDAFTAYIFDAGWPEKQLKQRMRHITVALHKFLPNDYQRCLELLIPVSTHNSGFEYMFLPEFVELYGLDDFELSMYALEKFTPFASAEFAIRAFILRYPEKTMSKMAQWAEADCPHLRRLASEGCRPRLPWAMSLPAFKENPKPVIKILEKLKTDPSEYVRRSVANNLNDISKDNPQLVYAIAKQWLGKITNTDQLVKHACRTLLKQGDVEVLFLFGFRRPVDIEILDFVVDDAVKMGGQLRFSFILTTRLSQLGQLRIEYAMDFLKANGKQNRKLFKLAEGDYQTQQKSVTKSYLFQPISTRVYYAGRHDLAIIVNGQEMGKLGFMLQV